jgi:hypothetical protein
MALHPCPECGKEISDKAPTCGAPRIAEPPIQAQPRVKAPATPTKKSAFTTALLLVLLIGLGFILWRLWQPGLQAVGIVPAPRWFVQNAGGDDSCTRLGDYCMRTKCLVRNIGDAAGSVRVVSQLQQQGAGSLEKATMLRLEPGQSETVTLDFPEAELGEKYLYACSGN